MKLYLSLLICSFLLRSYSLTNPELSINVSYIVHNTFQKPLEILTLGNPLESIDLSPCIQVKHNGRDLGNGQSFFLKRDWPPEKESFLRLEPGESVRSIFDLAKHFDFSKDGIYEVTITPQWQSRITQHAYVTSYSRSLKRYHEIRRLGRMGIYDDEVEVGQPLHINFSEPFTFLVPTVKLVKSSPQLPSRNDSENSAYSVGYGILTPLTCNLSIYEGRVDLTACQQIEDEDEYYPSCPPNSNLAPLHHPQFSHSETYPDENGHGSDQRK